MREVRRAPDLCRTAATPVDGFDGEAEAGTGTGTTAVVDLVGRWVALLDEAEALLAAAVADPDALTARHLHRLAGQAFDTLYASEHAMTPDARRQARAYVWRRDHAEAEPLPSEVVLQRWGQCLCRRCHAARVLGRPVGDGPPARSVAAAISTAATTSTPLTPPARPARAVPVQALLFPGASRHRSQRRHHMRRTGS